jgi:hypothetical protein
MVWLVSSALGPGETERGSPGAAKEEAPGRVWGYRSTWCRRIVLCFRLILSYLDPNLNGDPIKAIEKTRMGCEAISVLMTFFTMH